MESEEEAGGPRRRRGRTALLVCTAAVLGLVAGTCGGYLVQADRDPTRLPSLSQPVLAQAGGDGPGRLPAAQDRMVRTEGDLRKLLLKKPSGASEVDWLESTDGWMDIAAYSGMFEGADRQFESHVQEQFRRAAVTGWRVGDSYTVEIRLIQFRQEEVLSAVEASDNGRHWATWAQEVGRWPIPGTGDGEAVVHKQPEGEPGEPPMYTAEAHAWRGDIAMEIWVDGPKRIDKKTIMDLAERQMERL